MIQLVEEITSRLYSTVGELWLTNFSFSVSTGFELRASHCQPSLYISNYLVEMILDALKSQMPNV
jgi:hypothetical protein